MSERQLPASTEYVIFDKVNYARGHRTIFEHVSLSIPKGKITAIMGPSGTGKTTLLKLISGQIKPQHGSVFVNQQCINQLSKRELLQARRDMAMMFQANALFTGMTVFDNIAFPLQRHTNFTPSLIRKLVLMKLESVGLRGAATLMPSQLSGGMARRVALARATALDPNLMLYDEPFTGQDPISLGMLLKLIKELNDTLQMTSIIVSHDVAEVAKIADYIFVIGNQTILGQGSVQDIANSDIPEVRQFMHGLPDGPVPFHYPAPDYATDLLFEAK